MNAKARIIAFLLTGAMLLPTGTAFAVTGDGTATDTAPTSSTEDIDTAPPVDAEQRTDTARQTTANETSGPVLHVSATSTDEDVFRTLSDAVRYANSLPDTTVTIELDTDITATACARITDKTITLDGNGHTITRGEHFNTTSDNARSSYNPAMIEVTTPREQGAALILKNVTLDDQNRHEGTVFAQASDTDKSENMKYVQDGIIAAYGTENAQAEVVLADGTKLQNFGGMSAVRVTGGATLTMEQGSIIQDQQNVVGDNRKPDNAGGNGLAGAVWVQGTTAIMDSGALIKDVLGRAFYVDDGNVTIGGEITNIRIDKKDQPQTNDSDAASDIWQGNNGVVLHARGGSEAVLTDSAYIHDIGSDRISTQGSLLGIYASDLEMQKDATIQNITGISALYMDDSNQNYTHNAQVNGLIDNVHNPGATVMRSWYGLITLGSTGAVQNCTGSQVIYSNNGSHYIFAGTVTGNTGDAIYLANQSGGGVEATVESTTTISGNSGVGLTVNNGSQVTMEGGSITGNSTGVRIKSKESFKGVNFTMKGGSITDNSTGIQFEIETPTQQDKNGQDRNLPNGFTQGTVDLQGGEITDNHDQQIRVVDGAATSQWENVKIAPGVLGKSHDVSLNFGKITLDADYPGIALGRASKKATKTIKDAANAESVQADLLPGEKLTASGESLWFQLGSGTSLHFTMQRPTGIDAEKGLYAGYIPLNEDGDPADDATMKLVNLVNTDTLDISLTGLQAGTPYAMMLLSSDKPYITVTPADIIVYMGGEGKQPVVSDSGEITNSKSLPAPGFEFTLPTGATVDNLTFQTIDGTKTWTAEPYDGIADHDHEIYKIKPGNSQDPVRVQFTDEDGNAVIADHFDVGSEINKTFDIHIYTNGVAKVKATLQGTSSNDTYGVTLDVGKLTVLGTTDGVQVARLGDDAPKAGKPGVQAEDGTIFTINDSEIQANQDSIALLFDKIIENTSSESNRSALLAKRGDEILDQSDPVPSGMVRNYEFRYLDLVDTSNGNTWVQAKKSTGDQAMVTVSWPYPEGTSKKTKFTILHYMGLHRDMSANEVAADIQSSEVETITGMRKTDTHIVFTVTGFSPFALAWNTDKPSVPPTDDTPSVPDSEQGIPVYRVYNPNSGEHFYTTRAKEQARLVSLGWHDEGIGWYGATKEDGIPVYRLYNKAGGEHHYTTSASEKKSLETEGWDYEGIEFYSAKDSGYPVYRNYNPNAFANNHNFTANEREYRYLTSIGWRDEGIAWYAVRPGNNK